MPIAFFGRVEDEVVSFAFWDPLTKRQETRLDPAGMTLQGRTDVASAGSMKSAVRVLEAGRQLDEVRTRIRLANSGTRGGLRFFLCAPVAICAAW